MSIDDVLGDVAFPTLLVLASGAVAAGGKYLALQGWEQFRHYRANRGAGKDQAHMDVDGTRIYLTAKRTRNALLGQVRPQQARVTAARKKKEKQQQKEFTWYQIWLSYDGQTQEPIKLRHEPRQLLEDMGVTSVEQLQGKIILGYTIHNTTYGIAAYSPLGQGDGPLAVKSVEQMLNLE